MTHGTVHEPPKSNQKREWTGIIAISTFPLFLFCAKSLFPNQTPKPKTLCHS